jgi:hypothetical protein
MLGIHIDGFLNVHEIIPQNNTHHVQYSQVLSILFPSLNAAPDPRNCHNPLMIESQIKVALTSLCHAASTE